jgi:hypothetical protein
MIPSDFEDIDIEKILSPFGLKMTVLDADKYRKAYGSYSYGTFKKLKGKWLWVLIGGVIALVLILYFTGVISFR